MSDGIRLLPGFDRYGINEAGDIVSYRKRGGWLPMSKKTSRLNVLKGGKAFSMTPAKFRFCVDHQIDPTTFNSKDYCITADGTLITYSERSVRNNEIAKVYRSTDCVIKKITDEIDWMQSCVDYYRGNTGPLLIKMQEVRPMLIGIVSKKRNVPKSYSEVIVAEAEMQLLSALSRGGVISPRRWLFMRALGMCAERKVYRIRDYGSIQ